MAPSDRDEGNGVERLIGPREVAHRIGLPLSWVYAKAERGVLPSFKLGNYRRFRASEIEAWLDQNRQRKDDESVIAQR